MDTTRRATYRSEEVKMTAFAGPICIVPPNAVETASGLYVDVVNPELSTIDIHDIAWSLSRQARFAGHTISEKVWNVAQHSLFVEELVDLALHPSQDGAILHESLDAWIVQNGYSRRQYESYFDLHPIIPVKLGALLHDATEAYLIDLPSPVKRHQALRGPYKELEVGLNTAILKAVAGEGFELMPLDHEVIVWADLLALQIEAAALMPSRGRGWSGTLPLFEKQHLHLFPWEIMDWRQAYNEFISEYHKLHRAE